jgi:hypothetical protein
MPLKERIAFLKKAASAHFLSPSKRYRWEVNSKEERERQQTLFGYNLAIEYQYGCGHRYHKTAGRAILYLHPWGIIGLPNKRSADLLRDYNVLPGDIITFNFPDGNWRFPFPFLYTSFGQMPDVLPALYTLAYAHDHFGVQAVDVFGYSRGGAVAINMLAVLNDKTGKYDKALNYIGIDQNKRSKLLDLVQKGSLVLNCPLADTNATFSMYSHWVKSFFFSVTQYKVNGLQAIRSATNLDGLVLNVLLHFQFGDRRVFNLKDAELYQIFKLYNPDTTFLVLGDNGGHVHTQETLAQAIHIFYKKIGAAYDPQFVPRTMEANNPSLLQPPIADADRIIQEFYNACARKQKEQVG